MKLGKASWIIIIAGACFIVFASLGLAWSQQTQAKSDLNEKLSVAAARLANLQLRELNEQKQGLDTQLALLNETLAQSQEKLRLDLQSIDVTDDFYSIAGAAGVEVMDYTSSALSSSKLGSVSVDVINIAARVDGPAANIIDFVARLNRGFFTGAVDAVDINLADESTGDDSSATLRLSVFGYRGD